MIDLALAKREFEQYLKDYDLTDNKIKLKWVHTLCVVDAARNLQKGVSLRGGYTACAADRSAARHREVRAAQGIWEL